MSDAGDLYASRSRHRRSYLKPPYYDGIVAQAANESFISIDFHNYLTSGNIRFAGFPQKVAGPVWESAKLR